MKFLSILARLALALWTGGAALFTYVLTPAIFDKSIGWVERSDTQQRYKLCWAR